jgi:hypothetical protein
MMDEVLAVRGESAGTYPPNKIEKLATHLEPKFLWARNGCFELLAARMFLFTPVADGMRTLFP